MRPRWIGKGRPVPAAFFGLVLALAAALAAPRAGADEVHEITWESLLPAEAAAIRLQAQEIQIQLRTLPKEEQRALSRIATELHLRRLIADGEISADRLRPSQREILEDAPMARYPDAARLWAELERLKDALVALEASTNAAFDGRRVRLAGYLLPLEFDSGSVSEFLLVPYVGACIHVPPPPPNQIVHVALSERYSADALYAPVAVTGTLSSGSGTVELFLEDGSAPIDRGYRLDAARVEPLTAGGWTSPDQ